MPKDRWSTTLAESKAPRASHGPIAVAHYCRTATTSTRSGAFFSLLPPQGITASPLPGSCSCVRLSLVHLKIYRQLQHGRTRRWLRYSAREASTCRGSSVMCSFLPTPLAAAPQTSLTFSTCAPHPEASPEPGSHRHTRTPSPFQRLPDLPGHPPCVSAVGRLTLRRRGQGVPEQRPRI